MTDATHTDIMVAIARLEQNQDAFRADIADIKMTLHEMARAGERHEDKDEVRWKEVYRRVNYLETFRARAIGAYLALTALFTVVATWLGIKND